MTDPRVAEEVTPNAGDLIESLRDFGYTLPSALADLIDNSVTAAARFIDITVEPALTPDRSLIAVVDDGSGMDRSTLVEAMRLATNGPLATRHPDDLGRFGLGLKTAALSQGRRLTVITQPPRLTPVVRTLDIDHVRRSGRWELLEDVSAAAKPFLDRITEMSSGTAVIIENLDRATFLRVGSVHRDYHLGRALDDVRAHLAMVFHHRFIEDGVRIALGSTTLHSWDPFLHAKSTKLPTESISCSGHLMEVTPFVLPHHSKLTDEEHERAAGPNGWNAHQGFYVYRCRRLIVPGTWLNLGLRKEEHFKLARICLDLPNGLDAEWHLNVMKSHVAAPALLRDDFKRIASDVRRQAAEVYRYRGERTLPSVTVSRGYVWKREQTKIGIRYRLDRAHPVFRALLHQGCAHEELLDGALDLIDDTLPIAAILQDWGRALDGTVDEPTAEELDRYVELIVHAEQFLIRAGQPLAKAREAVLSTEPFIRHREKLLERLPSAGGVSPVS